MWNEPVPEVDGGFFVDITEPSNEVVLKDLDGVLGGVAAVDSRWY